MSNMGSATSHRRAAGETTEWEDILRKKGITTPSAEELALQAAAAEQAERAAGGQLEADAAQHVAVAVIRVEAFDGQHGQCSPR